MLVPMMNTVRLWDFDSMVSLLLLGFKLLRKHFSQEVYFHLSRPQLSPSHPVIHDNMMPIVRDLITLCTRRMSRVQRYCLNWFSSLWSSATNRGGDIEPVLFWYPGCLSIPVHLLLDKSHSCWIHHTGHRDRHVNPHECRAPKSENEQKDHVKPSRERMKQS